MTDLNSRFAFDAMVRRIDDPDNESVIIITVGKDRQVQTAAAGVNSDLEMFWTLHFICTELAEDILPTLTTEQKSNVKLVYPSLEEARSLGLVPFRRNGGRKR